MILILEVIATQPATPGGTSRQTFREDGGSIGRDSDNAWVLPDPKVSGRHAAITHRNGRFFIEDRSRNGVFLNSPTDRLPGRRPHALNSGDRIFIHPYEIRVSITGDQNQGQRFSELADLLAPDARLDESKPFDRNDRGAPSPIPSPGLHLAGEPVPGDVVDPLELLGVPQKVPPPRKAQSARSLDRGSPLDEHFQPPQVMPDPVVPAPASGSAANVVAIPQGYNPLADDSSPARTASTTGAGACRASGASITRRSICKTPSRARAGCRQGALEKGGGGPLCGATVRAGRRCGGSAGRGRTVVRRRDA